MGIRAVAENISDETDPVVTAPMCRVFTVVYRILQYNRQGQRPKLFQAAIECISELFFQLRIKELKYSISIQKTKKQLHDI